MDFNTFWTKHCPTAGYMKAITLYGMTLEVQTSACKDFNLAPFPVAAPCQMAECKTVKQKYSPNKGNNPMYVNNDKHIESSKINYLNDRLNNSFYKKEEEMVPLFNLNTPKVPDTAEKLVAAITSGDYTIKTDSDRKYLQAVDQITWRSPSIVPDQAGYDAARASLIDLRQTAKDTVAVGTPADALTAIKAIDAFVPVTTVAATTATA